MPLLISNSANLVKDILQDLHTLLHQEIAIVTEDFKSKLQGRWLYLSAVGAAVLCAFAAVGLFSALLVTLLQQRMGLSLWLSELSAALIYLVGSVLFLGVGAKFKRLGK